MPRTRLWKVAVALILHMPCAMLPGQGTTDKSPAGPTVAATGEILGELEPCGCTPGQLGGLGRRLSYLRSLREQGVQPVVVDNGDLVARCGRQAEVKVEILSMAMAAMGYTACNVGERDLRMGLAFLRQIQEASRLPFVAANVVDGEGQTVFPPYHVVCPSANAAAAKVGITGILSERFRRDIEGNPDGLRIADPVKALKRIIPDLRKQCGHIVLLSHCPQKESITLAQRFPEIALIVSGHDRQDPIPPDRVGNTLVVTTGWKGKNLIVCTLNNGDPQSRIVPLTDELAEVPEMTQLMSFYKDMVRSERLLDAVPARTAIGKFAGYRPCLDCHEKEYRSWQVTEHAHAYESLKKKDYHHDPECVGCHTIGFRLATGFRTPDATPRKANVGCECCHGPCRAHIREAQKKVKSRWEPPTKRTCLQCHTHERSPGFDYERCRDKVRH